MKKQGAGKHRRSRVWVAPHMQLPLMRMSLMHALVAVIVPATVMISPLVIHFGRGQDPAAEGILADATALLYLHDRFWLAGLAVFVLIVCDAMRVSHRIVGPLYRMTRVMREAARGQIQRPFVPRRRDYLHREAAALNELLAYTARIQVDAEQAAARLDQLVSEHGSAFQEGWLAGIEDARGLLRREASREVEVEPDHDYDSRSVAE